MGRSTCIRSCGRERPRGQASVRCKGRGTKAGNAPRSRREEMPARVGSLYPVTREKPEWNRVLYASVTIGRRGVFVYPALRSMRRDAMFDRLREDVQCVRDRDPAARSFLEILFLYPGLRAIRMHRRAHWCYRHRLYFLARAISQRAARRTGIEIHPAAVIGRRFFIDHGTGVVIGETAVIGDDVTIYQGVTLGGTGKDVGKRHPTIGNGVMIGAGAKVLGPFTVGDNSLIAAGAVVLKQIPPNCTAVGVPAQVIKQNGKRVPLDQIHIPDPVYMRLDALDARLQALENNQ